MTLSDDAIREFADIWEREFGERLSPDDARREASSFLAIYLLLASPPPVPENAPEAGSSSSDP